MSTTVEPMQTDQTEQPEQTQPSTTKEISNNNNESKEMEITNKVSDENNVNDDIEMTDKSPVNNNNNNNTDNTNNKIKSDKQEIDDDDEKEKQNELNSKEMLKKEQELLKSQRKKKIISKLKLDKTSKRVVSELKGILNTKTVGISAGLKDFRDVTEWIAIIDGPVGTPYEGGKFCLDIKFPEGYPFKQPKVTFKTRIYHCNVDKNGNICLDILKDKWSPALNMEKVLLCICILLQIPNPEDPLVQDIAHLYRSNRELHDKRAREFTQRYALLN